MPPPEDLQIASQNLTVGFQRIGFYGYHSWQILDSLQLTAGLSYDRITFPSDFRFAPISDGEQTEDQFSPKAGVIWTPSAGTTFRAAYTKSLGGASLDQSIRLEPSQVAGFNQAFRSIIPESVAAANAGATFESYSLALEQKLHTGTYIGLVGEILNSDVDRTLGVFASEIGGPPTLSSIRDRLQYQERSLVISLDQLVGNFWAFGMRYRLTDATLNEHFPGVPVDVYSLPERRGTLNQLDLHAICNMPIGFFAEFQALWNQQRNHTENAAIYGDDFWQLNLFAGYRFPRRRAELTVGLLNLADHDYRLDPITLYSELPHERTFMARLRFNF
jgi:outer membrane receptor protein involved in Fe transport